MNEIKYRAWDENKKEWVNGVIMNLFGETFKYDFHTKEYIEIKVILDLYTGLKDKHDKEIYKNDIVIYGWKQRKGKIIWFNYAFYVEDVETGSLILLSDTTVTLEIIGNIHEELLK